MASSGENYFGGEPSYYCGFLRTVTKYEVNKATQK